MSKLRVFTRTTLTLVALATLLLSFSDTVFANAKITIVNVDPPGIGFNDPTPAQPVGGNPGTTVGEQRLIAAQFAADIWGATLQSAVEIFVTASFAPLPCTAASAALAQAGTRSIARDFPGAPIPNTWYHSALANSLVGDDLNPGPPGTSADDLTAQFNGNLGQPNCLAGSGWYYGLDNNHGPLIDFPVVALHEYAHGLGFQSLVTLTTGALPNGIPTAFTRFTFDNTLGLLWSDMTNAQRAFSAQNANNVVWVGENVTGAAPFFLSPGSPVVDINSPPDIAGRRRVGAAQFGAPLSFHGVTGNVVLAHDGQAAPPTGTVTDACEPLVNADHIAGNVAMVDRGTCTFNVKVFNAQEAGAVAVLVADNVIGDPPAPLGGTDPRITISSARITLADGNAIKAQLAAGAVVNVTLGVDLTILAGADPNGRVLLNATGPIAPGSTISHWDPIAFPDLLMEPSYGPEENFDLDLTPPFMADIGWLLKGPNAADLSITKAAPETVFAGSNLIYTLNITNNGPIAAEAVKVMDQLPAGVVLLSCTTAGGDVCNRDGSITFTSLAAGATETVTLTVATFCSLANGTILVNKAEVTASTPDPDQSNNSAAVRTDVQNSSSILNLQDNTGVFRLNAENGDYSFVSLSGRSLTGRGVILRIGNRLTLIDIRVDRIVRVVIPDLAAAPRGGFATVTLLSPFRLFTVADGDIDDNTCVLSPTT